MRTVRRQGLTFRIPQPDGLRTLYLLVPQGLHKGRNLLFSGQHGILVESYCDSLMLTRSSQVSDLQFVTKEKYHFTIFPMQVIA